MSSLRSESDSNQEIIYEVNLLVNDGVISEFIAWLMNHMEEMNSIEGFLGSEFWRSERMGESCGIPEGKTEILVHYRLKSREALNHYLENHASEMREDGLKRFPNAFSATRRVLSTVK